MPFDERMLNGMGVLTAIVDCGSFAAAGVALDMSQSGVSRSVARLEARLGIRLFDRTTRSVTLTDEGRRFYEQIVPLLNGLEEAAASAAQGATAVRGRLRVNMDPFFSRLILGPRVGAFIDRHPDLHVELITRDQLGDIVSEGFDVAIRFGEPPVSSLIARKLLDTRILTVAAPSYLKRHGHPANPAELENGRHACIKFRDPLTGYPFSWEFHRGRKKMVVTPQGRLTVNDVGTLHSACAAGQGVAQILALGAESLLASGKMVELFPDWADEVYPLYALYPSRHHPPAKVRAFLDFIVSLLGAAQAD
ncbi:LysR family transcriptional regulator [bacterium M00.F.Ca.ET.228.01.1.1]|uniref:LysR family transcriptional regulator n=1 Tax=Paraburkholderia phenoliruptrix TaxID=252970 RepID=UPI00109192B3|nr:LysR family transcriptional regulator [Paraburkholderia phenoliruptrix]TGP42244.1 LysR family transcriptional regulator [bacterium M00.F.Ca.ET.228.01.1.1]TGR99893.1 LysR family transcriptional regulator [bacterium M00.F.Ca.ET.191.01.1.1]TGU04214.1 LysR family transcriptional regulator [bacterium M00.F.Ca.ET.155.01.1.1]MBW0448663.1 LysR family transcriptional regulator [Paraburkholderia phenoliruptrix]MBW9100475.1 LysR family transcriptional regulator [Paraburkholderia phenoliruptrix]